MVKFAVLSGDIVSNVIVADSIEIAKKLTGLKCIMSESSSIGDVYDAELGQFHSPVLPESAVVEVPELAPTLPVTE
jgi:hypothetical protein